MNFQIKKGLSSSLFDSQGNCLISDRLEEGCWYLTTDTAEIYVAFNIDGILQLKLLNACNIESDFDFEEFDHRLHALESEEKLHTYGYRKGFPSEGIPGHMYVAADEQRTYVWFNNDYLPVGEVGGSYEAPDVIFGGTAD